MKKIKVISLRILLCVIVTQIISCKPKTIEGRVEEMIETTDIKKKIDLALALADELNPKAVELLSGLNQENGIKMILDTMLYQYSQIALDPTKFNSAISCVGAISTERAAVYLGKKSMEPAKGHAAFQYVKKLPVELRQKALVAALSESNAIMEDSILMEASSIGDNFVLSLLFGSNKISSSAIKIIVKSGLSKESISEDLKLNLIMQGLSIPDSDSEFQATLLSNLKTYGEKGIIQLIETWYKNKESAGLMRAIAAYGSSVTNYLSAQLGKNENIEDLLAQIGPPVINTLLGKMKSQEQSVRFAAADALVKMTQYHPDALKILTSALDNQSLGTIAENHPFYIRLGRAGTEPLLLKALRIYFTKERCVDYINCGNSTLAEGGRKIAASNGYNVYTTKGVHNGPRWGSGNH
jgi:hypothetical protein